MEKNELNQNDMAEKLKVSKGHVSQILNGDSNFTLKKLINLSLNIGKVPVIKFVSEDKYIANEKKIDEFFKQIENPTYKSPEPLRVNKLRPENSSYQWSQSFAIRRNSKPAKFI